jgi:ketosteroid isomerase-like protein
MEMHMPDDAAMTDEKSKIEILIVDYWFEVDRQQGRNAHDYYTDAGTFSPGTGQNFVGHDQIRALYAGMRNTLQRTGRHCCSNVRIKFVAAGRAFADYVITLYSAEGDVREFCLDGPSAVCDVRSECERHSDGRWRFSKLCVSPLMVNDDRLFRDAFGFGALAE